MEAQEPDETNGRVRPPDTPHGTNRTNRARERSGLKANDLWSYGISGSTVRPCRYGESTEVQLWNVTDLAVQFVLSNRP